MLKQRVFTAVILIAGFLWLLLSLSAAVFSLVIMLLVMVAGWEWANLLKLDNVTAKTSYLAALSLVLAAAGYSLGLFGEFNLRWDSRLV